MHKKHLAVVPAVAALLAATTLGAHAIDIVVNSGDTVGSQSISGVGDSLLVEAGGVIEVFTGSTYPVYSTGANNTLVNFGGIYSYADCSYGIYAMGNYFSLTNNGQIETTNWASAGIYVAPSDNNALDTQILNNGMIWTQGEESHAISVYGTGTRIINDGSVLTSGDGSVGIYTWARNPGSDVVIVNTGVVYATGASYTNSSSFVIDAHAIQSKAPGAHIINSGIVISEQADAFALDAADQTLTMLAGSTVYGGIRFANADSGTLNLGSNLDAVLTITANPGQDLDDLTINAESGMLGVTRISATEHVVTVVSPQTVQAGTAAAANVNGSVGTMIAGHTGDRRQGLSGGSALLGYAPSRAAPAFPDFAPSDDFGIWASGYGTISARTGANVR